MARGLPDERAQRRRPYRRRFRVRESGPPKIGAPEPPDDMTGDDGAYSARAGPAHGPRSSQLGRCASRCRGVAWGGRQQLGCMGRSRDRGGPWGTRQIGRVHGGRRPAAPESAMRYPSSMGSDPFRHRRRSSRVLGGAEKWWPPARVGRRRELYQPPLGAMEGRSCHGGS